LLFEGLASIDRAAIADGLKDARGRSNSDIIHTRIVHKQLFAVFGPGTPIQKSDGNCVGLFGRRHIECHRDPFVLVMARRHSASADKLSIDHEAKLRITIMRRS